MDFSECHSKEVMFILTLSVHGERSSFLVILSVCASALINYLFPQSICKKYLKVT